MGYPFTIYNWNDIVSHRWAGPGVECYGCTGTALTVGGFDGAHTGHFALFRAVLSRRTLLPGIITFAVPPRAVTCPDSFNGSVYTLKQRLDIFREAGFAFVVVIDFSSEFGRMEGRHFLSVLIKSLAMKYLAEGPDFRCGCYGAMDIPQIARFFQIQGLELQVIAPVMENGVRVSSSLIRSAVEKGDLHYVSRLLGRPFCLDCSGYTWTQSDTPGVFHGVPGKYRHGDYQVVPAEGCYTVQVTGRFQHEVVTAEARVTCSGRSLEISSPWISRIPDEIVSVEFSTE